MSLSDPDFEVTPFFEAEWPDMSDMRP